MNFHKIFKIFLFVFLLALSFVEGFLASEVVAGGPFFVNSSGVAATFDNTSAIPYHPESGACATYSNAQMLTKLDENLGRWTSITDIDLSLSQTAGSIGSVDSSNYTTYIVVDSDDAGADDDLNPVIFDDDGGIVSALFGTGTQFYVLGFAGPTTYNTDEDTIEEGQAVFNCFCLSGNTNDTGGDCDDLGSNFTEDDLDFTMAHEVGHMIGLDHTQVNQATAEGTCSTSTSGDCDDVPLMYPMSVDPADQISPHRDDIVAILTLYGVSTWQNSYCTVTGTLKDSDGNDLRCADVQAETADTEDTIALVSGAFAPAQDLDNDGYTDGSSECSSDCGVFTLRGLDPDEETYTITVKPIDASWISGSGINPCASGQLTGVVEEEIATITDCTAGVTTDLGTITTESSGGTSGDDDDDDSATTTCGEDQNFESCDPIIDCSLSHAKIPGTSMIIFLFGIFFFVFTLITFRLKNQNPK